MSIRRGRDVCVECHENYEECGECGCCFDCCECDLENDYELDGDDLFSADELGLDPEEDDARRYPIRDR